MKKIFLLNIFSIAVVTSFAQKEMLDLTSYFSPKDPSGKIWEKDVTENITSYTIVNKMNNSWCRINIVKSTISKGSIEQDFESEWQELIVKNYNPTDTPQVNQVQGADGWSIKSGSVKFIFNNSDALAMITTISGYERCVSIVATTNSEVYTKDIEEFLSSVELKKPETASIQTPLVNDSQPTNDR